jgi:hypothetical protein
VPYLAYVAAEAIHVSGVLAVVAAGLLRGRYSPEIVSAEMRILARSVWNILVFLLNSLIFILIGMQLSGALSRLLLVAENYPKLKSDANFRDLQAKLESTETQIAGARNKYIASVQAYNVSVRSFPNNLTAMVFGYKPKPNFTVDNEKAISTAPKVDFATKPPQPGAPSGSK